MTVDTFEASLWDRHDGNSDYGPKYCPHCGEQIAHPDNLQDNDAIETSGRHAAYRRHREAHFSWGTDPASQFDGGDPFLDEYYDGVATGGTGPTLDEDEEVAGVYEVELNYEAVVRAKVVANNEHNAKERAELLIDEGEDLNGHVPTHRITHQLHDRERELKRLTRGEIQETADIDEDEDDGINYADRLPGWPW